MFEGENEKRLIVDGQHWLCLFSNKKATLHDNLLDTLCATLEVKMQLGPKE
jgi:hypothetical protein